MFPYVRGCDISENIRLEDVKEEEIESKHIQSWRFTELKVYAVNQRK